MQQKTGSRRRAAVSVGVAAATLVAIGALRLSPGQAPLDLPGIGVPAAAAGCAPLVTDPAAGAGEYMDGRVGYGTVPPSSGPHRSVWVGVNDRGFYTTRDAPEVEQLVHNLEHGYTVLWYDPLLDDGELDQLRTLAGALRDDSRYRKFIAAPWDSTRGELPDATPVVLSHWGADQGYRQFCEKVSGAAVTSFLDAHPASDSPEPNAP